MACETIKMEISSNPEYVSIIRLTTSGIANKIGFCLDDIEDLKVAISEACTNAIKHSLDDRFIIVFNILENGLTIEIIDEGQGYNTNLTGQVNQNANIQQSEVAYGINIAGEKVDYHSVVGDYTDEALESIDQKAIPENMKEAVKDYFEAINQ